MNGHKCLLCCFFGLNQLVCGDVAGLIASAWVNNSVGGSTAAVQECVSVLKGTNKFFFHSFGFF